MSTAGLLNSNNSRWLVPCDCSYVWGQSLAVIRSHEKILNYFNCQIFSWIFRVINSLIWEGRIALNREVAFNKLCLFLSSKNADLGRQAVLHECCIPETCQGELKPTVTYCQKQDFKIVMHIVDLVNIIPKTIYFGNISPYSITLSPV